MRLTTLGGSAAGPNPGQGCSGYLVESGGTRLVLDLGPGTLPVLRLHADFRRLDGVILSHLHVDHMLDVIALRYALAYNPVRPEGPIPLWLPPGGFTFLDAIARAFMPAGDRDAFFSVFALAEYDPDAALTAGDIQVRFHPTVHYIPCWAMRVSNGIDGDLFYTADTGPAATLVPFARGSRIIIAEGTKQPGDREPFATRGHLTPEEAGRLASEVQAEVLVLTHLWAENDPFRAVAQAGAAFRGQVVLATPGRQVTWAAGLSRDSGD